MEARRGGAVHHGRHADGDDDQGRRRPDLGGGRVPDVLRAADDGRPAALAGAAGAPAVVALGGQHAHRLRDGDDDGQARARRGPGSARLPPGAAREESARASACSSWWPRSRAGARRCPPGRPRASRCTSASAPPWRRWPRSRSRTARCASTSVFCAVDCGVAVNPDVIRAQMEGCIGFALGALYYSEIELKAGRPVQRNFDQYKALRIYEMPAVEVFIVPQHGGAHGRGRAGRAAARARGGQRRRARGRARGDAAAVRAGGAGAGLSAPPARHIVPSSSSASSRRSSSAPSSPPSSSRSTELARSAGNRLVRSCSIASTNCSCSTRTPAS